MTPEDEEWLATRDLVADAARLGFVLLTRDEYEELVMARNLYRGRLAELARHVGYDAGAVLRSADAAAMRSKK